MLHRTILTAVSVIALAATANAADLGGYKGGPAYAAVNWSGLYGGVNGGYGWGSSSTGIEDSDTWSYGTVASGNYGSGSDSLSQSKSFDSSGGFGGGQIGYNVQNGRVVFGVEGDIEASGISGSGTNSLSLVSGAPAATTYTSKATATGKLNDFGTLRARVGYTFDTTLVYVTGGLAYGDATDTLKETDHNGTTTSKSKNGSLTGYVLGAGAEHFLTPAWSVKAEYQYIDLGSTSIATGATPNDSKYTDNHTYNTVRVGLNYHVGAGFDPLK